MAFVVYFVDTIGCEVWRTYARRTLLVRGLKIGVRLAESVLVLVGLHGVVGDGRVRTPLLSALGQHVLSDPSFAGPLGQDCHEQRIAVEVRSDDGHRCQPGEQLPHLPLDLVSVVFESGFYISLHHLRSQHELEIELAAQVERGGQVLHDQRSDEVAVAHVGELQVDPLRDPFDVDGGLVRPSGHHIGFVDLDPQ